MALKPSKIVGKCRKKDVAISQTSDRMKIEQSIKKQDIQVAAAFGAEAPTFHKEALLLDAIQCRECNRQLKRQVENNKALRRNFTKEQLALIQKGKTPRDLVWHHEAEKGKIRLVDADVHKRTSHTGGRWIWRNADK